MWFGFEVELRTSEQRQWFRWEKNWRERKSPPGRVLTCAPKAVRAAETSLRDGTTQDYPSSRLRSRVT